jgi:hypothetical protein
VVSQPGPAGRRAASQTQGGAQETFETYRRSSGLGSEARAAAALEHWGANRFEVPLPQFADLLKEQLMAPFFVFQVFCVGLWCLDDYWRAALAGARVRLGSVLRLGSAWGIPGLLHRPMVRVARRPGGCPCEAGLCV